MRNHNQEDFDCSFSRNSERILTIQTSLGRLNMSRKFLFLSLSDLIYDEDQVKRHKGVPGVWGCSKRKREN